MKTALVVGVADYDHATKLRNPQNDAQLLQAALHDSGFSIRLELDPTRDQFHRALKETRDVFAKSSISLFFFAGHGVQKDGLNYLIPRDAAIADESDIPHYSIPLESVMDTICIDQNRISVIILDACRDNPFAFNRSIGNRGLSHVKASGNTIICFSTSPGDVALDGAGSNSPYTEMLCDSLRNDKLSFMQQMFETRSRVFAITHGKQMPWESVSLFSDFNIAQDIIVKHPDLHVELAYTLRNRIQETRPKMQALTKQLNESTEGGEICGFSAGGSLMLLQRHSFFEMGQFHEDYYVYNDRIFMFCSSSIRYRVPMYLPEFHITESVFINEEYVMAGNEIRHRVSIGPASDREFDVENMIREFNRLRGLLSK